MSHIVPSWSSVEEATFFQKLVGLMTRFSRYERPRNLELALKFVPVEDLRAIAQAKYNSSDTEKSTSTASSDASDAIQDLFLLELLRWFKGDFFTWTDKPRCPSCSKATDVASTGMDKPTPEELRKDAGVVELYTCCCSPSAVIRFPRYNDPAVLLQTKTGRCGEWANCFALICVAAGFETRHVTDWTDHVWVEIFSVAQNRWLHCDPCENACDTPLMYEAGWGKKLSYVLAASKDDIQDVTWRYSHSDNHQAVKARRILVDERWLLRSLLSIRKTHQQRCSPARRQILQERLISELVSFLCPTKSEVKTDGLSGRESGSLAWRLARQEIREDQLVEQKGFVSKINSEAVSKHGKILEFFYDPVRNEYFVGRRKADVRQGWETGVFESDNIGRKEEKDWKMVYLAREEASGTCTGKVSWKFELTEENNRLKMHSVQLQIPSETFHSSASILWELVTSTGVRKTLPASDNGLLNFGFRLKPEVRWFTITCVLSGGEGSVGYQQTQLFRESLMATREDASGIATFPPFVTITTMNETELK